MEGDAARGNSVTHYVHLKLNLFSMKTHLIDNV